MGKTVPEKKITVVTIAGPTGAGKTAAGLALAETFPISIINADSRQVYSDFPIITAQPTKAEQSFCPHHLYGWLATSEPIGVGVYREKTIETITKVIEEQRLPVIIGGTGLYLRTLLEGIAEIPSVPQKIRLKIQKLWKKEGSLAMRSRLLQVDPDYAAKIHAHDQQRTTRALEVYETTGKPFSWWHAQPLPPSPYNVIKVGIRKPLSELEPLLKKRIEQMLFMGAEEEAHYAFERCPDPEAPGWSGIGCKEMLMYISSQSSLQECKELWYKNTRAYAKRQLTWFNREKDITWFSPEERTSVVSFVSNHLQEGA